VLASLHVVGDVCRGPVEFAGGGVQFVGGGEFCLDVAHLTSSGVSLQGVGLDFPDGGWSLQGVEEVIFQGVGGRSLQVVSESAAGGASSQGEEEGEFPGVGEFAQCAASMQGVVGSFQGVGGLAGIGGGICRGCGELSRGGGVYIRLGEWDCRMWG